VDFLLKNAEHSTRKTITSVELSRDEFVGTGVKVKGSQKVCIHQFSLTEQLACLMLQHRNEGGELN